MSKKFQKKVEDFVCEVCGIKVKGIGYTDHCPSCLWSKHLDINPGDRASFCGGLMEPIEVNQKNGRWRISYCCQKCKIRKIVDATPNDNFDLIIKLSASTHW